MSQTIKIAKAMIEAKSFLLAGEKLVRPE